MAHAISPTLKSAPDWQQDSHHRLRLAMLVAAILVAGILSLFRMPTSGEPGPLIELVVRLIDRATESAIPEIEAESKPATSAVEDRTESATDVATPLPERSSAEPLTEVPLEVADPALTREIVPVPLEATDRRNELSPSIEVQVVDDWREFGTEVVQEFIASLQPPPTVNPVFDEKRRIAAIKFRPSNAPIKSQPWDSVERDQINRTILNLGKGCFQVLNDPSAVYRDVFENYTQAVVQCTIRFGKPKGVELPWVEEIRSRYPYLQLRELQKRDPDAFDYSALPGQ